MPDPAAVADGLGRVGTRIHHDVVLSSMMLAEPQDTVLLLPATTRYESPGGGTETSTERRLIFSPEVRGRRIGSAKPEWEVLGEVAARVRPDLAEKVRFTSSQQIRDESRARCLSTRASNRCGGRRRDQWAGSTSGVFTRRKARFSTVTPPARRGAGTLPSPPGGKVQSMVSGGPFRRAGGRLHARPSARAGPAPGRRRASSPAGSFTGRARVRRRQPRESLAGGERPSLAQEIDLMSHSRTTTPWWRWTGRGAALARPSFPAPASKLVGKAAGWRDTPGDGHFSSVAPSHLRPRPGCRPSGVGAPGDRRRARSPGARSAPQATGRPAGLMELRSSPR
jgi:hypothetical protein